MRVLGYTFPGYAVCVECHDELLIKAGHECDEDDGCWPIFSTDEWDYAPTCDRCGAEIEGVTILGAD
jgi:hypothetical protein